MEDGNRQISKTSTVENRQWVQEKNKQTKNQGNEYKQVVLDFCSPQACLFTYSLA